MMDHPLKLRETALALAYSAGEDGHARRRQALRITEALIFAASEPVAEELLARALPNGVELAPVLAELVLRYQERGVNLVRIAGKWTFRTAPDLGYLLNQDAAEPRKLSRAALETLAIIAYHQPVTRAEIEEIRGVSLGKGTLDILLEAGFIRLRGRRRTPGRPVTYGTTEGFLIHFGLNRIGDLPGLAELAGAGLIDGRLPPGFIVPFPSDEPDLRPDEDPLGPDLFAEMAEARRAETLDPLDPEDGAAHSGDDEVGDKR